MDDSICLRVVILFGFHKNKSILQLYIKNTMMLLMEVYYNTTIVDMIKTLVISISHLHGSKSNHNSDINV